MTRLRIEVRRLRDDPAAVERIARDELGMVRKSEVVFQFARGYLDKASVGEVEDTIGQVFSIAGDEQQGQGDQQPQGSQQQVAQPEQQQAEPQTIQLGMTTDQVQAALGKPEKIVNLGPKQLYVYKDLKVTFVNGKVSDVQ